MNAEIELWEAMAKIEVKQAKKLGSKLSNIYLLSCINNLRSILSNDNPYTLVISDVRYRTFVIKILTEYRRQELSDFEGFFSMVLMGRVCVNNTK